ncbi:hypothetical protein H311_01483 [Anncaliia algerae PRA109]|nr:hypothetical protein H311_01483 [Anncaliia algerae PRA109]
MPIIFSQVASGSIVRTDKHKSYLDLSRNRYIHNSVCHKYEFVNKQNGTNTQTIESLHNELKFRIKKDKMLKPPQEMTFYENFVFTSIV